MDITALVSDKHLLARLTREYELLKASKANINYDEWITKRLQVAAAAKQQRASTSAQPVQQQSINAANAENSQSPAVVQPTAGAGPAAPSVSPQQPPMEQSAMSQAHWGPWKVIQHAPAQPQWVSAAQLQTSLQSSGVVPLMHAAADRDRKLAATSALVRQQLAFSSSGDMAGLQHLYLQQQQQQEQADLPARKSRISIHSAGEVEQAGMSTTTFQQQAAQFDVHTTTQAAAAATSAVSKTAANANAIDSPPATNSADQHRLPQELLTDKVKNSWLLKAVLQPPNKQVQAGGNATGPAATPDFIRVAGEAGKQSEHQHSRNTGQHQAVMPGRRSQLKAALKQLLAYGSVAGQHQQLPAEETGSLQTLLAMQPAQPQQQGVCFDQQQQLHQVAVQLQQLFKALHRHASSQQQQGSKRREQDENVNPDGNMQTQQRPPSSDPRQHLRNLQQQRQLRQLQAAAAASLVGTSTPPAERQPQQHRQQDRPAWHSDVYVPPPSQLLKRKNAGFADVWNLQAQQRIPASRRASNKKPMPFRPASAKRSSVGVRTQKQQQQQQQRRPHRQPPSGNPWSGTNHQTDMAHRDHVRHHLSPVQEADDEQLFAHDLLAVAASAGYGRQSIAGQQQVGQSGAPVGGFGHMTAAEVQDVEQEVKQHLEHEEQQEEASRLSRLEDTASHILTVLARLEQQMQQPSPPLQLSQSAAANTIIAAVPSADASLLADPLQLSDLLSALDRMEAQEKEISNKWFAANVAANETAASTAEGTHLTAALGVPKDDSNVVSLLHQPAVASAVSTVNSNADEIQSAMLLKEVKPQQHQQGPLKELSNDALKAIKSGRRRFLRHQSKIDGHLEIQHQHKDSPVLGTTKRARQHMQPTLVVEAVADLLIDEMLAEQVGELDSFMDALCNQLFESEFAEV